MWRNAAAAIGLAAVLTACNDGDGSPTASPTPSTSPPTTTDLATPASTTPAATSTCPSVPPLPAGATVVTATVSGGRVTTAHRVWEVTIGSQVRVAVTSDAVDEVHVHTYDAKGATTPGCPTAIDFAARIPGTHEVELEKAHKRLFDIKVS